ncbi:MAG: cobalamin-dependent protein [Deltaproteobacteria bacterium]|nr:cobalamin-dependent protein [Deltaproteobacteria bacterium]
MDILFLNPVQTESGFALCNFTLLWLASYLRVNGYEAKVIYLRGGFKQEVQDALLKYKPRYVAVSCRWYTNLYGACLVSRAVKDYDDAIKVITGGNTATYFHRELVMRGEFDMVIRGDAEIPLLELLKNNQPVNATCRNGREVTEQKLTYVQSQEELDSYRLEPLEEILDDCTTVLGGSNYIWVGKGCGYSCFYCGGSRTAQQIVSGRTHQIIRPVKNVLHDIELLSRYSDSILFDFSDCKGEEEVHFIDLFRQLPPQKLSSKIFYWGVPSQQFLDSVSRTFKRAEIIIDVVTFNEQLRQRLSELGWTKPFIGNSDIVKICDYCLLKKNIEVGLESITGLPFERLYDPEDGVVWVRNLVRQYICLTHISCWPLSVEPASRIYVEPETFNLCNTRKSFEDFYDLTKSAFEHNCIYPYRDYKEESKHLRHIIDPYGTSETGSSQEDVYMRSKVFYDSIFPELQANRILFEKM